MADAASFVVSLVDKVTRPARGAMRQVDALSKRFKNAGTAADVARKKEEAAWRAMGRTQDKAGKWREANGRSVDVGSGPKRGGAFGTFDKFSPKIGKHAATGADWAADKATSFAKWTALGTAAVGGALGAAIVKNTVQMAIFEDTAKTAFASLTGSVAGGQKAWESSLTLSKELGGGVEDTANSMKHLLAMQFTLPQAEEMVRMSADLKAVTGDAHSAERALTAITQIKAKGKLQAEELVGQLAEAGVSTTLVYEELKKSMNLKTTADVQKAITAGKVTSDIGIEAIKAAIGHKTHSSRSGEAGAKYAQSTYGGLIGQLQNAPQFLWVRLGEAVAGNLEKLKPLVQRVIGAIDGIQGDQMTRFVGNVLDFMSKLVPLTLEFAAGFGEGFAAINDAMGAVDPAQASMQTARDLGKAVATAFEMAFKAIKMVADTLLWLDQHRGIATAIGVALGATKVVGADTLGKGVYEGGKWAAGKMLAKKALETAAPAAGALAVPAGQTGLAALAGTLGVGGLLAGGGAMLGLGAAGLSWAYREELANWLYGTGGVQGERGLGPTTATPLLAGMQGAGSKSTTNNVKFDSVVHIDGSQDPAAVGKQVADAQRGQMEQFFQGQALEAGAR